MKKLIVFSALLFLVSARLYSQQINPADLIGTWEQTAAKHATMQFIDGGKVRYSYRGHTGSTRDYYYLLNTATTPALLTVDYAQNHKKHRNEYLIELVEADKLKLQVLSKKDSRDHFAAETAHKTVTLIRQK